MNDFATLEHWAKLFRSGKVVLTTSSAEMGKELVRLTKRGFVNETDPYGERWKPKKRPDGRKVLTGKTRRLRGGWRVLRVSPRYVTITPSVDYAAPHQAPRMGRRPRRMMVPNRARGLPSHWSRALAIPANAALAKHYGK